MQSDLGLHCLFMPFKQESSVQNFRTYTIQCANIAPLKINNKFVIGKILNPFHTNGLFHKAILIQKSEDGSLYILRSDRLQFMG